MMVVVLLASGSSSTVGSRVVGVGSSSAVLVSSIGVTLHVTVFLTGLSRRRSGSGPVGVGVCVSIGFPVLVTALLSSFVTSGSSGTIRVSVAVSLHVMLASSGSGAVCSVGVTILVRLRSASLVTGLLAGGGCGTVGVGTRLGSALVGVRVTSIRTRSAVATCGTVAAAGTGSGCTVVGRALGVDDSTVRRTSVISSSASSAVTTLLDGDTAGEVASRLKGDEANIAASTLASGTRG